MSVKWTVFDNLMVGAIMAQSHIYRQRLNLIGNRHFLLFMLHSFFAVTSGAMCYIILTWHTINFTNHTPLINSVLISFSFWVPSILFSPFSGVVVDRYDRKTIVIVANTIRLLAFLGFSIAIHRFDTLLLCCSLNAINGSVWALLGPGLMAFTREIVPNDYLLAANSTLDIMIEIANIVGMAVASIMIVHWSIHASMLIIAFQSFLSILLLLTIHRKDECKSHGRNNENYWQQLVSGIGYLRERPALAVLYITNEIFFLQFMICPILLAPLIKSSFHAGGHLFSLTELSLSMGLIIGSLSIPSLSQKLGRIPCLLGGVVYLSLIFFIIADSSTPRNITLLYAILGAGLPLWSVIASFCQEHTDKSMQGRVQSIFNTFGALGLMLIYLGLGISKITPNTGYFLCTILGCVAFALLIWINQNQHQLPVDTSANASLENQ